MFWRKKKDDPQSSKPTPLRRTEDIPLFRAYYRINLGASPKDLRKALEIWQRKRDQGAKRDISSAYGTPELAPLEILAIEKALKTLTRESKQPYRPLYWVDNYPG